MHSLLFSFILEDLRHRFVTHAFPKGFQMHVASHTEIHSVFLFDGAYMSVPALLTKFPVFVTIPHSINLQKIFVPSYLSTDPRIAQCSIFISTLPQRVLIVYNILTT